MINYIDFKIWLSEKNYSTKTVSNIISRLKRADNILEWFNDPVYLFRLEQEASFKSISNSVKSQIKKSVKLYFEYYSGKSKSVNASSKLKVLSLFSNIGVAEAYLEKIGVDVVTANELIERRAVLYSKIYPSTHMICGDITDTIIKSNLIKEALDKQVDVIMATPPCQGMSTAGQQNENDGRNTLICPVIDIVSQVNPKFVFIENVPMIYQTSIIVDDEPILITQLLEKKLGENYRIKTFTINTQDYSVPQMRERAIILMTRRDIKFDWEVPNKDAAIVTMRDAIGDLPMIDPYITDVSKEEMLQMFPHFYDRKEAALKISKWNEPPHHIKRQVVAMQHTPTGCTAFDNEKFFPIKENGEAVKGYHNTYKRQNWDTAAYTVTMDNRKISSQNNVHPGRIEYTGKDGHIIYSDARTLTLYELMIIMSLPVDWPVPDETSEAFLRRIIGEGIPPLFVKKVFEKLIQELKI